LQSSLAIVRNRRYLERDRRRPVQIHCWPPVEHVNLWSIRLPEKEPKHYNVMIDRQTNIGKEWCQSTDLIERQILSGLWSVSTQDPVVPNINSNTLSYEGKTELIKHFWLAVCSAFRCLSLKSLPYYTNRCRPVRLPLQQLRVQYNSAEFNTLPHSNVRVEDDRTEHQSLFLWTEEDAQLKCKVRCKKDTQFKAQRSRNW